MMSDEPIIGYVPPTTPPPRRKPGRPPRTAPTPPKVLTKAEPHCAGCARGLPPVTLELADELIRMARDRMLELLHPPTIDILFLAARLDGYCSIGCWRQHGATEVQGKQMQKLVGEEHG